MGGIILDALCNIALNLGPEYQVFARMVRRRRGPSCCCVLDESLSLSLSPSVFSCFPLCRFCPDSALVCGIGSRRYDEAPNYGPQVQ